ncbi:methyltransferase domain-containing protein [Polyangium sp. 6x1]|uniref:class I SAM-dependent methyltransferase n=1 Tax=Polyangium sp. 6x1 TaxID=3042689 RepID=UPI00248303BB|nr:methyltransferase domain-containing protein [Polyangium sp. 6x1]MDI1450373.1 methyltransferase domain-containing protein [Polyangium sp. 6x1]
MTGARLDARVPQREIPSVYARVAWIYDAWAALTETRARRACVAKADVRDGETVLEVAVGTGLVFRELVVKNPSGRTEGVDLTEAMLSRARRKVEGLPGRHRLRVGDAHQLDFDDATFDLLVNNYMFDLLPERDFVPVLREMRRVLKPNGRLVLANLTVGQGRVERIYEAVYRISPALLGGCRGVALAPFVENAGFASVRTERVSQLGFPTEIVTARAT